jgi:hypothetical protein
MWQSRGGSAATCVSLQVHPQRRAPTFSHPSALLLLLQAVGDLPEDLEQLQLTQLDASSIQQALQCTSLQQPHQQQQQQQQQQSTDASAVANDAETVAAALGGLSCTDDPAASSNGQQQQQQQQLPCLLVAEVEGDESSAVQLVSGCSLFITLSSWQQS